MVRNVTARRVQCDEIWSFVYAKQKNVLEAKRGEAGDCWTWTALDADSKLIVSYLIGGRGSDYAMVLMDDLRWRLANRVQLTTDGHNAYLQAVEGAPISPGQREGEKAGWSIHVRETPLIACFIYAAPSIGDPSISIFGGAG